MLLQTSLCSIFEVYFLGNSYYTVDGLLLNEVNDDNSNHQSYNTSSPIKVDSRKKKLLCTVVCHIVTFFFKLSLGSFIFFGFVKLLGCQISLHRFKYCETLLNSHE